MSVDLEPWNHQVELSPHCIVYAQGQSFDPFCADREAESLTGLSEGATVQLGFDGAPNGMVHCRDSCTLSFFAEASCHQPLSSVRFYLINDELNDYYECIIYHTDPWNPDCDNDTLLDGLETGGWQSVTINSYEAIEKIIDTAGQSGPAAAYQYLTIVDTSSDPLIPDTDGDGLNDSEEWTCSTDARNPDSDNDTLLDGIWDDDPTIFHFMSPEITLVISGISTEYGPAFGVLPINTLKSVHFDVFYCIEDPVGIQSYRIYITNQDNPIIDKAYSTISKLGENEYLPKRIMDKIDIKLKVSQCFYFPSIILVAWDNSSAEPGVKTLKLGTSPVEYAEKAASILTQLYLGPSQGGYYSGIMASFVDTGLSIEDFIEKLGTLENLKGFMELGAKIWDKTIILDGCNYIIQRASGMNPYNNTTADFNTYNNWFACGYIIGMICQAAIIEVITEGLGLGALVGTLARSLVPARITVIINEIRQALYLSRIGPLIQGASKFFNRIGIVGRQVLLYAVVISTYYLAQWLFPDLFKSWNEAGHFGAAFIFANLLTLSDVGVNPQVQKDYTLLSLKYPKKPASAYLQAERFLLDRLEKGIFSRAEVETIMANTEKFLPLSYQNTMPIDICQLFNKAKTKWGSNFNLIDEVNMRSTLSWSPEGRYKLASHITENGIDNQLTKRINRLKDVPGIDAAVYKLPDEGVVVCLEEADKLVASGHEIELEPLLTNGHCADIFDKTTNSYIEFTKKKYVVKYWDQLEESIDHGGEKYHEANILGSKKEVWIDATLGVNIEKEAIENGVLKYWEKGDYAGDLDRIVIRTKQYGYLEYNHP